MSYGSNTDVLPDSLRAIVAKYRKYLLPIEAILMLVWFSWYAGKTDSYDCFYVVFGLMGLLGLIPRYGKRLIAQNDSLCPCYAAVAALFAIAAILANRTYMQGAYAVVLLAVGGWCVAYNSMASIQAAMAYFEEKPLPCRAVSFWPDLLVPFVVIFGVYLANLFLLQYPGNLSPDSLSQVSQSLSGSYNDHHPFWHTLFLSICLLASSFFSDDINVAIALYCVLQSAFMAAVYAYSILTVRQSGIPRWLAYVVVAAFAFLPYHVAYGSTVWKNVPFAGCVLLFSVALFRVVSMPGKTRLLDETLLVVGAIGFGLLQHNGIYALFVTTVVIFAVYRTKMPRVVIACTSALALVLILQCMALPAFGVKHIGERESISIPIQQIARTVIDDGIDDESSRELSSYIDVDSIAEKYNPHLSDPIKWSVDEEYYAGHKVDFFMLWARLGLDHPVAYMEAWVDQTKGYWFGGYPGMVAYQKVKENDLGIVRGGWPPAQDLLAAPLATFYQLPWSEPFRSIGLITWLAVTVFAVCVVRRKAGTALMALPALLCVGTLLISAPVYSEFRYAYALVVVLPVFLLLSIAGKATEPESAMVDELRERATKLR